jgi:hypothetical protein
MAGQDFPFQAGENASATDGGPGDFVLLECLSDSRTSSAPSDISTALRGLWRTTANGDYAGSRCRAPRKSPAGQVVR